MKKGILTLAGSAALSLTLAASAVADTAYFPLLLGPLTQDWSNTSLISVSDDWSGVPSITGYRGDDAVLGTGVDPQTTTSETLSTVVDVTANQLTPNTFTTGGVVEFELADPVVAFQGSGTADAANLVVYLNTIGVFQDIFVSYLLRDIDGGADNSIQPVALQYRIANTGPFTNVSGGFIADASSGPNAASLITSVFAILPSETQNQAILEVRIITNNALGSDELIGVDNIIIGIPEPSTFLTAISGAGILGLIRRRRR